MYSNLFTIVSEISSISEISNKLKEVKEAVGKVIVGQEEIIESILLSLLSDGHVLLEGAPGLAKTLLVRAFSRAMSADFKRIQFTPDLMPSDVTGISVYQPSDGSFKFTKGPVFTNLLLADEINRAPPKTQASMLEAMQERQVSSESRKYSLPKPFLVLATQNPIEQEGTYPLPEAQVDRFMFKLIVDYPKESDEFEIVKRFTAGQDAYAFLETITPIITPEDLITIQKFVREKIRLSDDIIKYIVRLAQTTRESEEVTIGASPRASLWLAIGAKAHALFDGREYVNPGDVQRVAKDILRHRVIVSPEWQFEGVDSDVIIDRVMRNVPVPTLK
jgi:MoxR-like ATPase